MAEQILLQLSHTLQTVYHSIREFQLLVEIPPFLGVPYRVEDIYEALKDWSKGRQS